MGARFESVPGKVLVSGTFPTSSAERFSLVDWPCEKSHEDYCSSLVAPTTTGNTLARQKSRPKPKKRE